MIGNPSDVVIALEPLVRPGVGDLAGLPSVNRSVQSTGDPCNRDGDRHRRDTQIATREWRGNCYQGRWLGCPVVPDGVRRGSRS